MTLAYRPPRLDLFFNGESVCFTPWIVFSTPARSGELIFSTFVKVFILIFASLDTSHILLKISQGQYFSANKKKNKQKKQKKTNKKNIKANKKKNKKKTLDKFLFKPETFYLIYRYSELPQNKYLWEIKIIFAINSHETDPNWLGLQNTLTASLQSGKTSQWESQIWY